MSEAGSSAVRTQLQLQEGQHHTTKQGWAPEAAAYGRMCFEHATLLCRTGCPCPTQLHLLLPVSLCLQATNVCPSCGCYAALHHALFHAAQSPCRYQYLTLLHFLDRGEWPHPSGNQPGQPSVANEHEWPRCSSCSAGFVQ